MLERQVTCLVPGVNMETYHGHVRTPADAIILFEACRIGLLPRVQRRLSEKERQSIRSGSIFVWDEREAGMRRWTDGKSWSASRVSGSFLTYREMEGKRGGSGLSTPLFSGNAPKAVKQEGQDSNDDGPDGYRYKPDGLMKQSFSITTSTGQHLHLISYYSRTASAAQNLMQPSNDAHLRHIRPERGMYPESTVHDHSGLPPVTQAPMTAPAYSAPHPPPPAVSPYGRPVPGAPPVHYASYAPPQALAQPSYQSYYGAAPHQYSPYAHAAHVPSYAQHAPPADHARANISLPPPPISHYSQPPTSYAPLPQTIPARRSPPSATHLPQPIKSEADAIPRQDSMNPRPTEQTPIAKPISPIVTLPPPVPGTTIPSISSLINGTPTSADERERRSPSSVSPGTRAAPDLSFPKPGFNHLSDVRALRDLDRATFRA